MDLHNSALTLGLAMAAGVCAQVLARHLAIPGIIVLLATGVLLGPDVLDLVRPDTLGGAMPALVGFAVAVILFAGAMNLDLRRLREERIAIRRLVTFGAVVTAAGATLAAVALLRWDWRLATLFGTLMIVTGPTVVTPLVRRLRLREPVGTILEAEGVLIDPIGAIIAVVALEVLYAGGNAFVSTFETAAGGLVAGALVGFLAGGLMVLLLRPRGLVPAGLENIFALSLVMLTFQLSEAVRPESGLAAVVVAGLIVGNVQTRVSRELLEFKEQLTVLMIGVLFVLLAADVRLQDVRDLGWAGVATVGVLIAIVRPLQVWLCTAGAKLTWRERAFLASMAPRGIVAAAVTSLFAQYMTEREIPGGEPLRALVFLVICGTVVFYGLTGGLVASALGLRQPTGRGYAFLGANSLSIAVARALELGVDDVVLVDSNADRASNARNRGFPVIHGQGLRPDIIEGLEPQSRTGCIALTPNEEVNLLFVRSVREQTRAPALYLALRRDSGGIPVETVRSAHASVLFGRACNLDEWIAGLDGGVVEVEVRVRIGSPGGSSPLHDELSMLILAVRRRGRRIPFSDSVQLANASEIVVAVDTSRRVEAEAALGAHGFAGSGAHPAHAL